MSEVSITFAKLKGEVTEISCDANVQFRYGKNSVDEQETSEKNIFLAKDFEQEITGLEPDTLYKYQAFGSLIGEEEVKTGKVREFRTENIEVQTRPAKEVRDFSATLVGNLTEFGALNADAKVFFKWSKEGGDFENKTKEVSTRKTGEFTKKIEPLSENQRYKYKAFAKVTEKGKTITVEGIKRTFKTKELKVQTLRSENVLQTEATLFGNLNKFIGFPNIFFEYAEEGVGIDQNKLDVENNIQSGEFSGKAKELEPGQKYNFRAGVISGESEDDGKILSFFTKNLKVSASPADNITTSSARLNGSLDAFENFDQQADVFFEVTGGNKSDERIEASPSNRNSTGSFEASLNDLQTSETYQYIAVAESQGIREESEPKVFQTGNLVVETDPATNISTEGATLNGKIKENSGFENLNTRFEWNEKGENLNQNANGNLNQDDSFSGSITNLTSSNTYEFRAVADIVFDGSVEEEVKGEPVEFTLNEFDVTTDKLISLTETTAEFKGTLDPYTFDEAAEVGFEYKQVGENGYPNTVGPTDQNSTGSFTGAAETLKKETTYKFRAFAIAPENLFDDNDDAKKVGNPIEFTTKTMEVSTTGTSNVTATSVTFEGNLDTYKGFSSNAAYSFKYGIGSVDENTVSAGNSSEPFSKNVTGLSAGETYKFQAVASSEGVTDRGKVKTVELPNSKIDVQTPNDNNAQITFSDVAIGDESSVAVNVNQTSPGGSFDITSKLEFSSGDGDQFEIRNNGITSGTTVSTDSVSADIVYKPTEQSSSHSAQFVFEHNASITPDSYEESPVTVNVEGSSVVPFAVDTTQANGILETSAVMNGEVTAYLSTDSSDAKFEYGQKGSSLSNTADAGDVSSVDNFSATATPLKAGTTYEFRAYIITSDGKRINADNTEEFSTRELNITSQGVQNVGANGATLVGEVDIAQGFSDVNVSFKYRKVGASSFQSVDAGTATEGNTFSKEITGLDSGANYEWKAVGVVENVVDEGDLKTTVNLEASSYSSTSDNINVVFLDAATDLAFSNDGTKVFVSSGLDDALIYEYVLGNPYDLSSSQEVNTYGTQETYPTSVQFNNLGTKMFVGGTETPYLYKHSLSSPFDLSSAEYNGGKIDVSSKVENIHSIEFNIDGTKMFLTNNVSLSSSVHEYTIDPFDITTATHSATFNGLEEDVLGLTFGRTGKNMVASSFTSDKLNQYVLSNPFDLSSNITKTNEKDVSFTTGLAIENANEFLFIIDRDDDVVRKFKR